MAAAVNLTPEQRRERARDAARARTTPDAHINALVKAWPPLTEEQRGKLRGLLEFGPVAEEAG